MNEPDLAGIPTFRVCRILADTTPWRSLTWSVVGHLAILLMPLMVAGQLTKAPEQAPAIPRKLTKLFIPKPSSPKTEPPRVSVSAFHSSVQSTQQAPAAKVPLDMSLIEISFVPDTGNQLPDVIRQQRGVLALVDKNDPTIAHYVFEPPQWTFHPGIVDISGKVRFAMYPPEKWSAVNALVAGPGLQLDQFEVSALFEPSYIGCLRDAISLRVNNDPRSTASRVTAARLAFSAASPCGIDVLEVSFAPTH